MPVPCVCLRRHMRISRERAQTRRASLSILLPARAGSTWLVACSGDGTRLVDVQHSQRRAGIDSGSKWAPGVAGDAPKGLPELDGVVPFHRC